ncbi:neutral cholesterol ester hydrolase 1-like [Glandiceps talaboti]
MMFVVGIAISSILAYMLYCPLPRGIAQPILLRIIYALQQPRKLVTFVQLSLGLNDPIEVMRSNMDFDQWTTSVLCKDEPSVTHTDTTFDGVSVRVYQPVVTSTTPTAGMVYIHGGGWVVCSKESYHYQTRHMAARLGIVLVSIGYRRAPEHTYPIPLEDSVKATVCFLQHAREYGVDPTRIAVVGDSAGGNLAAAVSAKLTFGEDYQTMNLPKIKFQGLIYPALQAVDFLTPSCQQNDIFMLTQSSVAKYWSFYLTGNLKYAEAMKSNNHTSPQFKRNKKLSLNYGLIPDKFKIRDYKRPSNLDFGSVEIFREIQDKLLDPYVAPLMRPDLDGLPPAYIVTAEFDVLRDDGILYAKRLEEANVPVTWKHYDDGFHGIFSASIGPSAFDVGRQCMADFLEFSNENL